MVGDVWIADPDGVTLASDTVDVGADIDIITVALRSGCRPAFSPNAMFESTGSDAGKCASAYRSVTAAINVFEIAH